jgi:hypothetical protein
VEMAGIEPASRKFDQRCTTGIVRLQVFVSPIPPDENQGLPADDTWADRIGVELAASRIS